MKTKFRNHLLGTFFVIAACDPLTEVDGNFYNADGSRLSEEELMELHEVEDEEGVSGEFTDMDDFQSIPPVSLEPEPDKGEGCFYRKENQKGGQVFKKCCGDSQTHEWCEVIGTCVYLDAGGKVCTGRTWS